MTAEPPKHRRREVPWLDVVRFHKDVVSRAERSFFSLNGRDDQADRWSSLSGFVPADLAGPWSLSNDQLRSSAFRLTALQGQQESIFLGGPCYLGWEQSLAKEWVPQWRPLLYREVTFKADGDGLELTPAQGKWALTPLFFNLIDRLEIKLPTSLDDFAAELIEEAFRGGDGLLDASQLLMQTLIRKLPSLEGELSRPARGDTFRSPPSPWVLFAPTGSFSALTRHLMKDYERLEFLLSSSDPDTGGLKLLEDRPFADMPSCGTEVSPFVPLNPPQKHAVEVILRGDPLTVVSGPPGTGKSQVVVALLLNAWAQGKTVLFASNNNKAVDVIRERIERFESEFPIAVRAGSKAHQNIQEVLRRTLNMAATAKRAAAASASDSSLKNKRKRVLDQRARLVRDLESGVPQRIEEARRAALQGYSEYQSALADLGERQKQLTSEQAMLGQANRTHGDVASDIAAAEVWIGRIPHYKTLLLQDEQKRAELAAEVLNLEVLREKSVAMCGLAAQDAGDWSWLSTGATAASLVQWELDFRAFATSGIDDVLEPQEWEDKHARWVSAEAAEEWARRARAFAEGLRRTGAELAPKLKEITRLSARLQEEKSTLPELGVPENVNLSADLLRQWIGVFAEFTTRERSSTDWLPWSRRAGLERRLGILETQLRPGLPLAIWTSVGTLNEKGRTTLAPVLDGVLRWVQVKQEWVDATGLVNEVEVRFRNMRAEAAALKLRGTPGSQALEAWTPLIQECDDTAVLADSAAAAWRRRAAQESAQARLRSLSREGLRLASGMPLREAWAKGIGAPFVDALSDLDRDPSTITLVAARSALYAGSWSRLVGVWQRAHDLNARIAGLTAEHRQSPSEAARIRGWWRERPKETLVLDRVDQTIWPELSAAQARLNQLRDWCIRARAFQDKELPEGSDVARHGLNWALSKLRQSVEILPPTADAKKLHGVLAAVESDRDKPWPVAELTVGFTAFSPERLQAEVDRLTSLLERSAFEEAKAKWLARLNDDDDAVRAVDALEKSIRQHKGEVPETAYETFRSVLRAIPIWITTAQAAQAIPLEPEIFDLVVIDEASQCTLTNLLPLVYRGKTLAVIGDDNQLPAIPTIQITEELALAAKYGIEDQLGFVGHATNDVYATATESLPRRRADVLLLTEHFRSHPQIIGFSNRHIYRQRLELKKNPNWGQRLPVGGGVHSVPVPGTAQRGERGRSWLNVPEADKVVELVKSLRQGEAQGLTIGVVTPFAAQKDLVRKRLDALGLASDVLVDTAYGFQGDERDVIIFTTVIADGITPGAVKWVESPPNLLNVALTRAREALFVVADFDRCLRQDGILRQLALYCKEIQLLRDTSPAELELFSWMTVRGWVPKVHPRVGDLEVDFVLDSKDGTRLAIEVDGRQYHESRREEDAARDAFLSAKGYGVLRIPAREVLETPLDVLHQIGARLTPGDRD